MAEKLILKFSKLLFLTTLLILSSCGGSSDSSGSIPSIDNLSYSPQKAFLNDDGGSITVNGTITFNDPDGDVSSYVLTVYDSNLNAVSKLSDPIPGVVGMKNGTLLLSLLVNTTVADIYSVEVYLIDSKNNSSNTLTGEFPIIGPTQTLSNIPDTGVDKCYNQTGVINCPLTEAEPYYGQDYQYISNPASYKNNGDGTITDNVTSLMWQMDHDGLLYNWYEATGTNDTNNNPGKTDVCGELTLGGYTNWRLPNRHELESIVNYGVVNPAIDTTYFPNTGLFNYFSSTEVDVLEAWYGEFSDGSIKRGSKISDMHLLCVRGSVWGNNSFTDNGDGTVTDAISGLMWQKAGQGPSFDWEEILGVCEGLNLAGYTDWRLADIKELATTADSEASLNILQGVYCSATTIKDENESVWVMQFSPSSNYGEVFRFGGGNSKSTCSSFYSRCVR